jgi:glycosyltransferase involved in cell wall biosynthesis
MKYWSPELPEPASKSAVIAHLIATNFYGGPEKQILEHLVRLDEDQYRAMVVSFLEGKKHNEILGRAGNLRLRQYGIPMSSCLDFSAVLRLIRLLRKKKVRLLCTHGYKSTLLGWVACRWIQIPIIAFSRGYTSENRKVAFYEAIERHALKKVDGIVCVSEAQRQRLSDYRISNEKTWVVHNAVSTNEQHKHEESEVRKSVFHRLGLSENKKLVVSAGRLSPEKGHRFLIEAVSKLGNKGQESHFIICGEGPSRKDLTVLAQELEVSGVCRLTGFRNDLNDIFRAMDLMVLPSLTEGLPNVILEAFAYGKAVVATAVGGVPEIVDSGQNGILVPPERSDLLSEAILKLLESHSLRKEMGKHAYLKVQDAFTFEKQNMLLQEIYQSTLNWTYA